MKTATRLLRYDRTASQLTIVILKGSRRVATDYRLAEVDCDFGRSFNVTKLGASGEGVDTYCLNVGAGQESCECLDFLSRHRECKHIAAVKRLLSEGKIGG